MSYILNPSCLLSLCFQCHGYVFQCHNVFSASTLIMFFVIVSSMLMFSLCLFHVFMFVVFIFLMCLCL
jgi:hypothetical protein